jgi:hypothetical protein
MRSNRWPSDEAKDCIAYATANAHVSVPGGSPKKMNNEFTRGNTLTWCVAALTVGQGRRQGSTSVPATPAEAGPAAILTPQQTCAPADMCTAKVQRGCTY